MDSSTILKTRKDQVSICQKLDFPNGLDGKESACIVGDLGSIPGSGRLPEEGNGNRLQYSCLKNSMGRGTWWATVHGVARSLDTIEQLISLLPFSKWIPINQIPRRKQMAHSNEKL